MSSHKEPTSKQLEDLYNVVQQKGVFGTQDEFMNFIDTEGVGQLYSFIPEGTFGNAQEFFNYYEPFLKKKRRNFAIGVSFGGSKYGFYLDWRWGSRTGECFFGFTYGK